MPSTAHNTFTIDDLRRAVRGTVIGPDDSAWADTTTIFYG